MLNLIEDKVGSSFECIGIGGHFLTITPAEQKTINGTSWKFLLYPILIEIFGILLYCFLSFLWILEISLLSGVGLVKIISYSGICHCVYVTIMFKEKEFMNMRGSKRGYGRVEDSRGGEKCDIIIFCIKIPNNKKDIWSWI